VALGYPHSHSFAHVGAGLATLTGATGSRQGDAVTILVEVKDRLGAATAMVTCETKAEAFAAISRFGHAGLEIIRVANQIAVPAVRCVRGWKECGSSGPAAGQPCDRKPVVDRLVWVA
jgi:hypothetical protein